MKLHRFDSLSFVTGLLITVVGLIFLIPNEPRDLIDWIARLGNWVWPVLLLAIGLAVLVPVLVPGKEKETSQIDA